jgi:endonuclease/exonuclease/phosphatase (EEP) superfamily protein YafD
MNRRVAEKLRPRRYWPLWLAVAPFALWALVRAFGLDGAGKLAPLMAFTPYAAIAAFLLVGVCVALRNWAAALLSTLACLVLAVAVLPRSFGGGEEAPPGATRFTVLSANVYRGHADPAALLGLVDRLKPDLLNLQELTPSLEGELRRRGIARRFPESVIFTQRGVPGAGIYSTHPLVRLPPLLPSNTRLLSARFELAPGMWLRVVNVHPFTPAGNHAADWADELDALPGAGLGAPWLLVGDFNATLDHAELRNVLARGYRDAGDITGHGLVPTWPNNRSFPPLITIDHVLADERVGISSYGVADDPGSDHRAIWARLFLR